MAGLLEKALRRYFTYYDWSGLTANLIVNSECSLIYKHTRMQRYKNGWEPQHLMKSFLPYLLHMDHSWAPYDPQLLCLHTARDPNDPVTLPHSLVDLLPAGWWDNYFYSNMATSTAETIHTHMHAEVSPNSNDHCIHPCRWEPAELGWMLKINYAVTYKADVSTCGESGHDSRSCPTSPLSEKQEDAVNCGTGCVFCQ